MAFKESKIKRRPWRPYKKSITKKKKYQKSWSVFKSIALIVLFWMLIIWILTLWFIYNKYIKDLPDVSSLTDIKQPEASTFYDKNWVEFYTFSLSEKRTYVEYKDISKNIINWVVSIEDKSFFENSWVDTKAILRSIFNKVTWKTDNFEGTSTVSQQLVKNVFLTNEKSIDRKIKEAYMSYMMNREFSKEKIMELYLNKLEFWSNAFWVEQASKTFFDKSSKDLDVLEWSIIASLPKSPTLYSPYSHYWRLVWYSYKYEKTDTENKKSIKSLDEYEANMEYFKKINEIIWNLKYSKIWDDWKDAVLCWIDEKFYKKPWDVEDSCIVIWANGLMTFLNDIIVRWADISYSKELSNTIYEYQTGRKDNVLWRLLEDSKITFEEYQEAVSKSFGFTFNIRKESLKYPHFSMYVRQYLMDNFGQELLEKWWLKVYTTLDSSIQDKAEEVVKKQAKINSTKFWAKNAALVMLDNKTGWIIAMVWSADYFNDDIDGQVNVITTEDWRKPGSSFKPIIYSIAMENFWFGSRTPIFDLETKFGYWSDPYMPNNFDGKFMWKMNISTALDNSRNIPAVKMFFLSWWIKNIISNITKLWFTVNDENKENWNNAYSSISLWTVNVNLLELAWAYTTFANLGYKKQISPILEIKDKNNNTIEKLRVLPWEKVMNEGIAYIMNEILSTTSDRPASWNNYISLNWRKVAAKTWTATWPNTDVPKKDWNYVQYPSDLLTIWYTPEVTTVAWAWNNKGLTYMNWNGLEWAWPMWKEIMEYALKWVEPSIWNRPSNVTSSKISSISGLLVPEDFPSEFTTTSLFLKENVPTKYDEWMKQIKVDSLCNGKVTANTPAWAIKNVYYVNLKTIDPGQDNWNESLQDWIKNWWANSLFEKYPNIITNYTGKECFRSSTSINNSSITLSSDINDKDLFKVWENNVNVYINSWNPISRVDFLIWNIVISSANWNNIKNWTINAKVKIPASVLWKQNITIRAYDNIYFSKDITYLIWVSDKDYTNPTINIENPVWEFINIYEDQFFNLRAKFSDRSWIRSINLYLDWKPLKLGLLSTNLVFPINENKDLAPWDYELKIEAIDQFFNKTYKIINLTILER